jgi:hypothetical protein
LIGSKPAVNVQIELSPQEGNSFDGNGARIFSSYELTTNEKGEFQCDRVTPGPARIGRRIVFMVNEGATEAISSQRVKINLPAGETTEVKLGGTGRPVIGKLLSHEGFEGQPLWSFARLYIQQDLAAEGIKPPAMPKLPEELKTEEEKRAWWIEWSKSPEGKAWQEEYDAYQQKDNQGPQITAAPHSDGIFRLDDLPSGAYTMRVYFDGNSAGQLIGYKFVVPPMEGDRSDEPLDIGEIRLEKNPR